MKKLILLALGSLLITAVQVFASDELNNEHSVTNVEMRALAKDLPATVVVRVNKIDNSVAVLHSKEELAANDSSKATVLAANFTAMDVKDSQLNELDRDTSTKAWYRFYFNNCNYSYPTYYYYGYQYYYTPYYYYNYANYYYYYYWYRWW